MTKYDPKKWDHNVYGRRWGAYPTSEVFKNIDRTQYLFDRPSDVEYERRHKAVRKFMENRGLDCLIIQASPGGGRGWTNLRWMTNMIPFFSDNAFLVFPLKGEPTLYSGFQWVVDPYRRAQCIIEDVRGGYPPRDWARMIVDRIKELGYDKGKIGLVGLGYSQGKVSIEKPNFYIDSFPINDLKIYDEAFPKAQFEFVTNDWWQELRLIKSPEEIQFMEKACEIGDKMVEAIVENVRPGMTEAQMFGIVHKRMYECGGTPILLLLESTNTFRPNSAFHRPEAKNSVLQHGECLHQEMWVGYCDGSYGSVGYTIFLGQPSKEYLEMSRLLLRCYEDVVNQLRPGKTNEDLENAAFPLLEAGYANDCPICWGIPGRNCRELPSVHVFPDPHGHHPDPFVLKPGMTPHVRLYPKSTDFTRGVEIGEMWLITEGEPRCLNKFGDKYGRVVTVG